MAAAVAAVLTPTPVPLAELGVPVRRVAAQEGRAAVLSATFDCRDSLAGTRFPSTALQVVAEAAAVARATIREGQLRMEGVGKAGFPPAARRLGRQVPLPVAR
ncbi:hypothetical protein CH276_27990 [Rhodococcus sp. 06-470-2]|nr:hypothetical protein CH276_27990 [Rhodococcus sp. 06-470-2]OZE64830.1 hypothetical protein CH265_10310 [Rhodococcus sp. 05-2221-1B]